MTYKYEKKLDTYKDKFKPITVIGKIIDLGETKSKQGIPLEYPLIVVHDEAGIESYMKFTGTKVLEALKQANLPRYNKHDIVEITGSLITETKTITGKDGKEKTVTNNDLKFITDFKIIEKGEQKEYKINV